MKKILCAIVACSPFIASVYAQSWPEKPISLVVPFPAGGSTDTVARALALHMGKNLGQAFVVDNRPGATGTIGASYVARAQADGYTIMVASLATYVIAPHLLSNTPYDATRDFDYISLPVQAPNVLVTHAKHSANTVEEVIALLKENPGAISFSSSGSGSSDHLSAELFWQQTDTEGLHIPYRGGAPAINDLLGGQVDFSFQNVNAVLPYIKAGRLKPIAVTGEQRSAVLPDTPTLAEAGVEGAQMYSWQGMAAPKGIPSDIKEKLAQAAEQAINTPDVKALFEAQGMEVLAKSPQAFAAFQQQESQRWKNLIETRNITAN